jgi:hypothetical protein
VKEKLVLSSILIEYSIPIKRKTIPIFPSLEGGKRRIFWLKNITISICKQKLGTAITNSQQILRRFINPEYLRIDMLGEQLNTIIVKEVLKENN